MTNLTVKETSKIFEKFRKYGKNAQITYLYFSVKPFQTGGFNLSVPKISAAIPSPSPAWLGRSIATSKLRLLEHSAFVDQQRETDSYHKHLFVHIGGNYEYSDPSLEVGVSLAGGVPTFFSEIKFTWKINSWGWGCWKKLNTYFSLNVLVFFPINKYPLGKEIL